MKNTEADSREDCTHEVKAHHVEAARVLHSRMLWTECVASSELTELCIQDRVSKYE